MVQPEEEEKPTTPIVEETPYAEAEPAKEEQAFTPLIPIQEKPEAIWGSKYTPEEEKAQFVEAAVLNLLKNPQIAEEILNEPTPTLDKLEALYDQIHHQN